MVLKEGIHGMCEDCGKHFTYAKESSKTHTELLKKIRCPNCGNFALKTLSTDL